VFEFVPAHASAECELKSVADYGMNSAAKTTNQDATAAIETANRFVVCIHRLVLSQDSLQT
jgi:hypothetical protein